MPTPSRLAGGYKTETAFLQAHLPGVSRSTLHASIRVARHFEPDDEKRFGTAKLALLIDYQEAMAGGSLGAAKLDARNARVVVKQGKTTRKVRFPELTFDELRAAARAAKGASSRGSKAEPPVVKKLRELPAQAKLAGVGVRLRDKKLDLSGIGVDTVAALGKALARFKA